MKRSRYTEQQIAFALKQAELGTPVEEVCSGIRPSGEGNPLVWQADGAEIFYFRPIPILG